MIIIFVVYPRTTQALFNARTPTWLNQKEYTTKLNLLVNYFREFEMIMFPS